MGLTISLSGIPATNMTITRIYIELAPHWLHCVPAIVQKSVQTLPNFPNKEHSAVHCRYASTLYDVCSHEMLELRSVSQCRLVDVCDFRCSRSCTCTPANNTGRLETRKVILCVTIACVCVQLSSLQANDNVVLVEEDVWKPQCCCKAPWHYIRCLLSYATWNVSCDCQLWSVILSLLSSMPRIWTD